MYRQSLIAFIILFSIYRGGEIFTNNLIFLNIGGTL